MKTSGMHLAYGYHEFEKSAFCAINKQLEAKLRIGDF